ncbi:MAG TPA: class I SAM-dependent methyltransferase [Planctomycetota bacterium]|nr:class I SAM-dependent methyltransferase [Planctomycetota bacterium]
MPPRLYAELADWWPLVSPSADYADEAQVYAELLRDGRPPEPRLRALELGSGGGHCSLHMRDGFVFTLSDVSPEMLALSHRLQPDLAHELGDMRTMRLGREFDAVFVHDAIMYMTTRADLEAACRTAFVHCRSGGVALFLPDFVRETFAPGTDHGGGDAQDRALRYLEWVHDADGHRVPVDFVFALREQDNTRIVHDHHEWGLFSTSEWLEVLQRAGFAAECQKLPGEERLCFVARRS